MSILQSMNVNPEKELASEIAAEEANPTDISPTPKEQAEADRIAAFDAEEAQAEAASSETEPQTTETQEETAPAVEGEDKPRLVPLKALTEARERLRQLEERNREYEQYIAEQRGYQRAHQDAYQAQQNYQEPPDPETDPIGALKYERDRRANLERRLEEEQAYREQQIALENFKGQYTNDMRVYVNQKPEAKDAYTHVFNNRVRELVALGVPEAQAHWQTQQEEINLVSNAYRNGKHPGDVIMQLAQTRGFQAKPAVAPQTLQQKAEVAKAKTAAAVGGMKGGSAPKGGITAEDLVNLEGAAFDKAWEKFAAQARKPIPLR